MIVNMMDHQSSFKKIITKEMQFENITYAYIK